MPRTVQTYRALLSNGKAVYAAATSPFAALAHFRSVQRALPLVGGKRHEIQAGSVRKARSDLGAKRG